MVVGGGGIQELNPSNSNNNAGEERAWPRGHSVGWLPLNSLLALKIPTLKHARSLPTNQDLKGSIAARSNLDLVFSLMKGQVVAAV